MCEFHPPSLADVNDGRRRQRRRLRRFKIFTHYSLLCFDAHHHHINALTRLKSCDDFWWLYCVALALVGLLSWFNFFGVFCVRGMPSRFALLTTCVSVCVRFVTNDDDSPTANVRALDPLESLCATVRVAPHRVFVSSSSLWYAACECVCASVYIRSQTRRAICFDSPVPQSSSRGPYHNDGGDDK